MEYVVRRAVEKPELEGLWDGPAWQHAPIAPVANFHAKSSDHRPKIEAKLFYDDAGLYVMFRVEDRYVVCKRTENQTLTCKDSCVEFFIQPKADKGYFNFEMNCGGTMLLYYVTDPRGGTTTMFKGQKILPQSLIDTMRVFHSMPKSLPAEITEPVTWTVEYFVPYSLFEEYVGPIGSISKQQWRGNFFKCADESSHPHWATWSPIGAQLNFHQQQYFGTIRFE